MKTAKTINIPFTPVDALIDAELEPVLKPFIRQLRAAAEEDLKLIAHRDEANPNVAAEQFDAAYTAAVLGDAAAEAAIPAVQRAGEKAQAQHRTILRTIGENEADSQGIAQAIGWRCTYLADLAEDSRAGEGARGLLDRAGFTTIVLGGGN